MTKCDICERSSQVGHRQEHGEQLAEGGAAQRDKDCLQTGAGDLDNVYHLDNDDEVGAISFAIKSQVEVCGDTLVGSDKDNNLFFKTKTSSDVKGSFITLISLGWIQR